MSIDLVIQLYTGMHHEGEIRMVNRILDSIHEGVGVMIGAYRGQMNCAAAMHAHIPIYCVDPHIVSDSYPFSDEDMVYWMTNVLAMGCGAKLRPVVLPSLTVAKIWDQPISFLFIDGDHSMATQDLEAWLPHVMVGGLVAFHDTHVDYIRAAFEGRPDLEPVEIAGITTVLRKTNGEPQSPYEPYEHNGLSLLVRKGVYNHVDKHAVQDAMSYPLPDGPINTVIDAGAMIGDFTVYIKKLYPDARVMVVEPERDNYDLLSRNLPQQWDRGDIYFFQRALNYDPSLNALVVDPINSGGHILTPMSTSTRQINVQSVTLEELMSFDGFDHVDLLKLDIEGCEMNVLLGAADDTLRRIHHIVGERHFTHEQFLPVILRLESLGFTVVDMPHPELSVAPWFMADRGVFTATNDNWGKDSTPEYIVDHTWDNDQANAIVSAQEHAAELRAEEPYGSDEDVEPPTKPRVTRKPVRKTTKKARK